MRGVLYSRAVFLQFLQGMNSVVLYHMTPPQALSLTGCKLPTGDDTGRTRPYLPWLYVSLLFSEGILAKICSVTSRKLPPHHACLARIVVPRATTANRIAMATAGFSPLLPPWRQKDKEGELLLLSWGGKHPNDNDQGRIILVKQPKIVTDNRKKEIK